MTASLERLVRIESTLAIQQLPIRYAMAVDSRDLDSWIALFVEDVDCGRLGKGRAALKSIIAPKLANFYRSVHFICGHRIDFIDPDHARGAVYCRAEHEDGDQWIVMAICYFDSYERRDGQWYFARRREDHWYSADHPDRPAGPNFNDWSGPSIPAPKLPGGFPTWKSFWDAAGSDAVARRTYYPAG